MTSPQIDNDFEIVIFILVEKGQCTVNVFLEC